MVMNTVLRHTRGNQLQASELLGIADHLSGSSPLGLAVEKQLQMEFCSGWLELVNHPTCRGGTPFASWPGSQACYFRSRCK